jgi:hypothetical protein
MIIVEIGRGLGNSMYVYAAALALAKHHNTELKLDATHIKSWPKFEKYGGEWDLVLNKFKISAKEATDKEIRKYVLKTKFRPLDKVIEKYKWFEKDVHKYGTFSPVEGFFNLPDNIYLKGYFGHEKFFKSIRQEIIKEFELKEEHKEKINPLLKKIKSENSVAIHVRRGDLVTLDAMLMPVDYYKKAIEMIRQKVSNPIFYLFSDEPEWCKENLKLGVTLHIVKGNASYEDLELMKNCKHQILANSAMSWWAGYLNNNPRKIVIAPKQFTHWEDHIEKMQDVLPKDWIKIDIKKDQEENEAKK